jgi:uncharacterized protein (UPF0332 family)
LTPEQTKLIRKATQSIEAARLLARQGFYDFAVSRAYYAMFYVAEAFLLGEGLQFSKHTAVIAAFGHHFAKTERVPSEFHRYLIKGQDSRLLGDYDTTVIFLESHALEQIERAEKFIALAERMLTSEARLD